MSTSPLEELLLNYPPEQIQEILYNPRAWAEALLITPNTGELFKANYVQQQILGSKHRRNVIRVHRRAGKTFSMTVLALFYAIMVESCQILVIAPTGAQVKEIFTSLREFLRVNPWIEDMKREDQQGNQPRIRFSNGSRITGFTTAARSRGRAMSLRGQGADIILIDEAAYLHEEDWGTIQPILQGDEHRRFPPRVFVASTPAYTRGTYYELCTSPRQKKHWHRIHVPITQNPSLTQEFIDECSATCLTELDWIKEYLAEFPEIAEGVFPKLMVDRALRSFKYPTSDELAALARAEFERRNRGETVPSRTIGVDWDKFNKDGHGSNICVLESTPDGDMRVVYREEIPQSKFTLMNAVQRVIELNEIYQPVAIYVDRGYGDYQLEELQARGKRFPHTKLMERVVGVQFGETIDVPMPGGGVEKKRFKQAMIALLRSWFERSKIEISEHDHDLIKQLIEYHVVSQTEANLKFSEENDHGIAALGLAAMAMHQKVTNPYAPKPAHRFYVVQAPEAVPSRLIPELQRVHDPNRTLLNWVRDPQAPQRTFNRGSLGQGPPPGRSGF